MFAALYVIQKLNKPLTPKELLDIKRAARKRRKIKLSAQRIKAQVSVLTVV
jgi:hypothetical protein